MGFDTGLHGSQEGWGGIPKTFAFLASALIVLSCQSPSGNSTTTTLSAPTTTPPTTPTNGPGAQWAKSLVVGTGDALFNGVAIDSAGSIYSVGSINGTSSTRTPVIAKYNSVGVPQWTQTLSTGSSDVSYSSTSGDGSGNIYAVGTGATGNFGVIVKYNGSGTIQWTRTLVGGAGSNCVGYSGVAADSSGNVYVAGYMVGTCDLGGGLTVTGFSTPMYGLNSIVVKYNSAGVVQWSRVLTAGTIQAQFTGIAVDSFGNSYAVGYISGSGTYGFGNGVTVTGVGSSGWGNPVIVKYDNSGNALWAKSMTSGTDALFQGVSIDTSGNPYAVGYINGSGTYGFGNGITAQGTSSSYNPVLVKYSSSGAAQLAQTLRSGTDKSMFDQVRIDSSGNIYAVGYMTGAGVAYGFGNGVTATGTSGGLNPLFVKYDRLGVAQWAQTLTSGTGDSGIGCVTLDGSGNAYTTGVISGTGAYCFGNGVTVTGTGGGYNALIVKYSIQ